MKTLLLSLVGITGTLSSSIVPIQLINNKNNISKIGTVEKTKTFSFNWSTAGHFNEAGVPQTRYLHQAKQFLTLVDNFKKFIKENNLSDWSISKISVNPNAKDLKKVGNVDKSYIESLDSVIRAIKIPPDQNKKDTLYTMLYCEENQCNWSFFGNIQYIKNGSEDIRKAQFFSKADNTSFSGYDTNFEFTLDQIKQGFTYELTVNYSAPGIDISAGNEKEADVDMLYGFQSFEMFKNNDSLEQAADILQELNYNVELNWLEFKKASLIIGSGEVDDKLFKGEYGAGEYRLEVTVQPSELGKQNNLVGEMTYYVTLKFAYGDLKTLDDTRLVFNSSCKTYDEISEAFVNVIPNLESINNNTSLYFLKTNFTKVVKTNVFLDAETNKELTSQDFEKMTSGQKKEIYTFVSPTPEGKELGILNDAKVFATFEKA